jgi:ABC-type transport system substrate-binding protein
LNYETGNIDGWLASGYTGSPDQTQWTVTLKPGTEWSDGSPLTSDDVVFTINMLITHAPLLNFSIPIKKEVASVTAVDDRTIQFTLNAPDPFFVVSNLAGTTSQAIVPVLKYCKTWTGHVQELVEQRPGAIFSGPSRQDSAEFDSSATTTSGAPVGCHLPAPLKSTARGSATLGPNRCRQQRCGHRRPATPACRPLIAQNQRSTLL